MGLVNEPDWQIVYSDTPGVLDPAYKLQEGMMKFVRTALQDADLILLVTDINEDDLAHPETFAKIADMDIPVFILINKLTSRKTRLMWANESLTGNRKSPGPPSPPSARCTASTSTSCSNESWSICRSALRISPRTNSRTSPCAFSSRRSSGKKSSPTSSRKFPTRVKWSSTRTCKKTTS